MKYAWHGVLSTRLVGRPARDRRMRGRHAAVAYGKAIHVYNAPARLIALPAAGFRLLLAARGRAAAWLRARPWACRYEAAHMPHHVKSWRNGGVLRTQLAALS